jgi:hypothetical protein
MTMLTMFAIFFGFIFVVIIISISIVMLFNYFCYKLQQVAVVIPDTETDNVIQDYYEQI